MHQCPRCGLELDPGRETCPQCGGPLEPGLSWQPGQPWTSRSGPLPMGEYLKQGWELFKQYPWGFVGFTIFFLMVQVVLHRIGSVGGLIGLIINTPLAMAYFVVSVRLLQGHTPASRDFFTGFQFLGPLLLMTLVSSALVIIGLILLLAPGIYLMVSYLFASILIVDRRLNFWQALETSRRTLHPRWFSFFAFFLVIILINLGGALLLGLGLLVTIPFTTCAWTVAYADIFGLQSDYSGSVPRLRDQGPGNRE
ncbi:MAG: zinc ribbon domain-containing protein [Deltaproteobacteria bacterium]|nr:zinc ribbon domain-containing protein [Deltaproteobacteria bacterium]